MLPPTPVPGSPPAPPWARIFHRDAALTWLAAFAGAVLFARSSWADPARFDLAGPQLEITVTHGAATLPISRVPNLSPGDRIWIKADLPPGQAARYLLVTAFLRGATNPPPVAWFHQLQTWSPKAAAGLTIVTPPDAQQLLVFLAPKTGGDFKTLVGAVRGRPGAFVRASQELGQAALDRSRLDAYLVAIRKTDQADPEQLKSVSALLARVLAIKLDAACFQKAPMLQAACLMQGQDSLVLNDGHSGSLVQALTAGPQVDLIQQLSSTTAAGGGYYSPYIGAIMDIGRLFDSFHTAQYQYIPALATFTGDRISLLLNTAPSFHEPLSVLVIALPAVEPPRPPSLQPADSQIAYCAAKPGLVLAVEGAPLVFSTAYARDMALRLKGPDGEARDLPVRADASKGGLVIDNTGLGPGSPAMTPRAVLRGYWGFEPFEGPSFQVESPGAGDWGLAPDDRQKLVVGRDDTIRLLGPAAACVEDISLQRAAGETQRIVWKPAGANAVTATAPLDGAVAGPLTLLIKTYGEPQPRAVLLHAFAQAGRLDSFTFHAGDLSGVLKGARLDEVRDLNLAGVAFAPAALAAADGDDALSMTTADARGAGALRPGETVTARVTLKDGRTDRLEVSIGAARPSVSLISKSARAEPSSIPGPIQLADKDEVARGATLTFSVRAQSPAAFTGRERIEVGGAEGAVLATLTGAAGLIMADTHVLLATLDTGRDLGASAFGLLRYRIVEDGVAGDWQPLATLVRLPVIKGIACHGRGQPCDLSGADLFLIDALSADAAFEHAVEVPEGFTGDILSVPHPVGGRLYLKLHDDPAVVDRLGPLSAQRLTAAATPGAE